MAEIIWDESGQRFFETGIDRGVFYNSEGMGHAWNGLTSVTESPSGGESTPYYIDGIKYLNVASRKEFQGTIEAYTYPNAFAEYDGYVHVGHGLVVDEQPRMPFGLSYRTRIGNDLSGSEHAYKIHLIYNVLTEPSENEFTSIGDEIEPVNFSWAFSTTPIRPPSGLLRPISHVVIDSMKTNPTQLMFIEQYLYGTTSRPPTMPSLDELFSLFENPMVTLIIQPDPVTGISQLTESDTVRGDLRGRLNEGLYSRGDFSRLFESTTEGIYNLES
jgi:hypothetical protein